MALFDANDDTAEMVQRMLDAAGIRCLIGCHFADLTAGTVHLAEYLATNKPQVVIFDISSPSEENHERFIGLRDNVRRERCGLVLTTTNRARLGKVMGADSTGIEVVYKPYDLPQIAGAIDNALRAAAALAPESI